jgi:hypothetical protein
MVHHRAALHCSPALARGVGAAFWPFRKELTGRAGSARVMPECQYRAKRALAEALAKIAQIFSTVCRSSCAAAGSGRIDRRWREGRATRSVEFSAGPGATLARRAGTPQESGPSSRQGVSGKAQNRLFLGVLNRSVAARRAGPPAQLLPLVLASSRRAAARAPDPLSRRGPAVHGSVCAMIQVNAHLPAAVSGLS